MRTTLTIEDDLYALLEARAHAERRSVRDALNSALREVFSQATPAEPYRVRPHDTAFAPGLDPLRLNQLADDLEDEHLIARLTR